jgi:photosystem II stability/assembly factor-like uncharacterized protein
MEMGGFADDTVFAPDYATSGEIFVRLLYYKESGHTELWNTRDGGRSWARRGPRHVSDLALAPDYTSSGRVVLATGVGLLESLDRGESYRRVTCPIEGKLSAVAVAGGPEAALLAAAEDELVVSTTDGGRTWRSASLPAVVKFLVAGADASGRVSLIAGTFTDGLFVSRDEGESFAPVEGGPQLVIDLEAARDFASSPTVIAAGYHGPWISRDAGERWELLTFGAEVPPGARR